MGLRINTNIAALNAHRNLTSNDSRLSKSLEKLSSGLRINRASDDAAGLAISEKMETQVRGLQMASKNALDAISMIQTAEGALQETTVILQRMRELSVQSANDTNTNNDRANLQEEITQLWNEIDRIANTTEFNTKQLLNNSGGLLQTFQIGANSGQIMTMTFTSALTGDLGLATVNVATATDANTALTNIDAALDSLSYRRSQMGAVINRLEHTISNLDVAAENLSAAKSRIRDLDMAKEVSSMSRAQILQQSSTAMLAQANQTSQAVLQLLQG